MTPDLFSTAVGGASSPATKQISSSQEPRHVLPKDLPNAVKHLNDEELDRLLAATLAEAKRRGRDTTPTDKRYPSRNAEAAVSLTRGQLTPCALLSKLASRLRGLPASSAYPNRPFVRR